MSDELLDIEAAAARLNVSDRYLRRLVYERRIPHVRIGRYIRFELADIDAWIASLRVGAD